MYELYSGTPISLGAKIQKNFVCYAKGLRYIEVRLVQPITFDYNWGKECLRFRLYFIKELSILRNH